MRNDHQSENQLMKRMNFYVLFFFFKFLFNSNKTKKKKYIYIYKLLL